MNLTQETAFIAIIISIFSLIISLWVAFRDRYRITTYSIWDNNVLKIRIINKGRRPFYFHSILFEFGDCAYKRLEVYSDNESQKKFHHREHSGYKLNEKEFYEYKISVTNSIITTEKGPHNVNPVFFMGNEAENLIVSNIFFEDGLANKIYIKNIQENLPKLHKQYNLWAGDGVYPKDSFFRRFLRKNYGIRLGCNIDT